MAVESSRSINIKFSGDFTGSIPAVAANNAASPGSTELKALAATTDVTITPPTGAKACTIIFPTPNTTIVKLKRVAGDTGIDLHPTDPTSIALNDATQTFVLRAAALLNVYLVWS